MLARVSEYQFLLKHFTKKLDANKVKVHKYSYTYKYSYYYLIGFPAYMA